MYTQIPPPPWYDHGLFGQNYKHLGIMPTPSLISKGVWLISYNIMNDWRLSYLIIHFIWTSLIKWTFVHSTYMPLVVMIFMRCSWVSYNLFIYLFKRSKYFLHSLATYQLHHRDLSFCSRKQFCKSTWLKNWVKFIVNMEKMCALFYENPFFTQ